MVALMHRFAKAHGLKAKFEDWADAPAGLRELVIGLGKVAFQGLEKKQLYFTDVELEEAGMPEAALELGLLMKSESTDFWKRDEYAFSHLTLQEFLAAVYVSSEFLRTDADMTKLLTKCRFHAGHLGTFWVFLAGLLSGNKVEALLHNVAAQLPKLIQIWLVWGIPLHSTRLFYHCFAESHLGKSGTPSTTVSEYLERNQVHFLLESLSVSDCAALSTVLRCHPACIYNVSLDTDSLDDSRLDLLLSGLQHCKSIMMLGIRGEPCELTTKALLSLSAVLAGCASTLEELWLTGSRKRN